jgi:small subunit ribosomal protein S4e
MGNKGPTKHLKRHRSPAFWPIHRKGGTWAVKPSSGPHSQETSIPTTVILRDQLNYAVTAREAKSLIKNGKLLVDGKVRKDDRFPVGLMDVVTIPDTKENFRVLPDHGGKLKFLSISKEESQFKLCRIIGKTTQNAGKAQLNLHDGSNILVTSEADQYKVGDVLKVKVPEKEIQDFIEFKEMQQVIITGGRSQGAKGVLITLGPEAGWKKTATIRTPEGDDIRTLAKYLFVVGSNEPVIKLDEVEE